MIQPNVTISSTQKNDFSIKENSRIKITKEDVKKVLKSSASFWKNPMYISTFGGFDSAILSRNIQWFVNKLNEISSKSPSFDLVSFLEKEIRKLATINFKSYDDYYYKFSNDLNLEFQKVKGDLDDRIIAVLAGNKKVESVFKNFNIANPTQTKSYIKLINEIKGNKDLDPKWNFIQDNLKKIIDNLEKNKISSYQIEGLTGFYNKTVWNNEFSKFFNKLGQYDTKKANDGFAKVIIESIFYEYKQQLEIIINKNRKTFEYRDLVEILQNNSKNLDPVGKIEALFPGTKAIIEKIQKHSDNKKYGVFNINTHSLSENMKNVNLILYWNYGDKHVLIDEWRAVQNSKSDVQIAVKKFNDDSYMKFRINPKLDFTFRALAKAKNQVKNIGQIYKKLISKNIGEMSINEFLHFIKYSGEEYYRFGKIIDDIKNLKNNKNNKKLNVDFKVTYQIDDLKTNNLLLKLVIWDKSFRKIDDTNKDQIDSINLTKGINSDSLYSPKISIKSIPKEIISLLAGEKFEIGEQDFNSYDLNKNNKLDINYLKKLSIDKDKNINGKKYKSLEDLINKYQNLGLSLSDIEIDSLIKKNRQNLGNYLIHFLVTDKSLLGYRIPSSTWGTFGSIRLISLKEQLEKLGILEILHEYSGKPNSMFDTKNLTPNIDGPTIASNDINNSLKLNDKNTVSSKSKLKIIDRLQDIFIKESTRMRKIDFANKFPFTIKWVTEKGKKGDITGHGIIWKFNFEGISAFDSNSTSLNSNDYNVVYEFTLATLLEEENSKKVVKKYGENIIDTINKNPLVTEEKRELANNAIDDINKVIDGYISKVDNNSLGWQKIRLKKEESDAILKISKISDEIKKMIGSSSIVKEISRILGRKLKDEEAAFISQNALLFADLLAITKDKNILEEVLKNKELSKKLVKIAGKPIFRDAIKTLLKIKDNYQYAYLGVGIASGVAGLAGVGLLTSSLKANSRLKKMSGKQVKIKGAKLISVITAFVTLGSIATSIVTLLWFFISKGGI